MQIRSLGPISALLVLCLSAPVAAMDGFVYLHDIGTDAIHGYRLGRKGELSALPGSPFAGPGGGGSCGGQCQTLTYDRRQRALFAGSPAGVTVWNVARDGSLSPVAGSPFNSTSGPGDFSGIAAVRRGRRLFVYAADFGGKLMAFEATPLGSLLELPGSPLGGFQGPGGVAAARNKLFVVDEVARSLTSFVVERDGGLVPAPGPPVEPVDADLIFSAVPDRRGRHLYVADDGIAIHVFRVAPRTAELEEIPGSPFGTDEGRPNTGVSVSRRLVLALVFESDEAEDGLAFKPGRRTGEPVALGGVSTGLRATVHAFDRRGRRFVAASSADKLIRSFVVDRKTRIPLPVDTLPIPGGADLTGIVVVR